MTESIAHYTLLERLGVGALGALYRARDSKTGRTVALRLLGDAVTTRPEAMAHLEEALKRAALVSHPNVAAIYDVGCDGGHHYYAQEFVPGRPLLQVTAGLPLHPRRALACVIEIADAVADAEASALQHGRLTSSSIIVTPKGHAKLLDVGFADWALPGPHATVADTVALGRLLEGLIQGTNGSPIAAMPREIAPILTACANGGFHAAAVLAATLRDVAEQLEAKAVSVDARTLQAVAAPSRAGWWIVGALAVLAMASLIWLAVRT